MNGEPMRPGSRRALALAAFLAARPTAACDAPDGEGERVVHLDSAGVAIVESTAPLGEDGQWRVEAEPRLDLTATGSGPAHEFYRVRDATWLADGGVVVAEPTRLRFFTAEGRPDGEVGREGDGPGEFRAIGRVERLPGDSLLVWDRGVGRVTILGPDRSVQRLARLEVDFVATVRALPDGTLAALLHGVPMLEEAEPGALRVPAPVVRLGPTGSLLDTVTVGAGADHVLQSTEFGLADVRPLFARTTHLATRDGQLVLGDADVVGFEVWSAGGRLLEVVRVTGLDPSLPDSLVELERAARLEMNPSPANRALVGGLPRPASRPTYAQLEVDPEGRVWAAEHRGEFLNMLDRAPRRWRIWSADGSWLGEVLVPGRFQVLRVGGDALLGVARDENDVERVQLLAVRRSGG